MTLEQIKDESKNKLDELYHKLKMSIPEKDYVKLEQFLLSQLEKVARETRKETVDKAFDWIWNGWNLDLGNLDRAKEHFLSLKQEERK